MRDFWLLEAIHLLWSLIRPPFCSLDFGQIGSHENRCKRDRAKPMWLHIVVSAVAVPMYIYFTGADGKGKQDPWLCFRISKDFLFRSCLNAFARLRAHWDWDGSTRPPFHRQHLTTSSLCRRTQPLHSRKAESLLVPAQLRVVLGLQKPWPRVPSQSRWWPPVLQPRRDHCQLQRRFPKCPLI